MMKKWLSHNINITNSVGHTRAVRKMQAGARFVHSFWETDFNGTLGFDLLCKRVKEGQKTCKDIEDFLKKRAKIEVKYSKDLRSLTSHLETSSETGDLGLSVQELRRQTDRVAILHENSALENTYLADSVSKFLENYRLESKQYEDRVKDRQKSKRASHSRVIELQKTYHEKCRDFISADNQHDVAKQSVTMSHKEIEKARVKAEKGKEYMEKADTLYKQAVETLEQWRRVWSADMEDACEVFQREEEDRIYLLRDILWKYTNIDSQLCVDWDEACESIRTCLERCDVSRDVSEFIHANRTGSDRPVAIDYVCYFEDTKKEVIPTAPRSRQLPPVPPIPGGNAHRQGPSPVPRRKSFGTEYSSIYSLAK